MSAPGLRRSLLADGASRDPLEAIAMAPGEPAFYWRSDERDVEIAGLGAAAVVDGSGPSRLADASSRVRALRPAPGDGLEEFPLAVGGFGFDDREPAAPWEGFPALRFFVPRVLWVRRGGRRRIVVTSPQGRAQTPMALLATGSPARTPASLPAGDDADAWRRRVDAAVDAIRAGDLDKIVLARRQTVEAATPVVPLLRALAEARPSCFTFLVRWSGRTFLGSSPERLLGLAAGVLEADALAGTAPRGHSKAHDESLVRELVASAKEGREHRIVADAIRDALAPFATEVTAPAEPTVLTLPEAHHLRTPVRAAMKPSTVACVLDVAAALHPTPAVCGSPRAEAFGRLAADEPDRGWYGGAVGWIDGRGEGELAVALRAALLDGGSAHVWAGAGIVEGSSAEREFDETERKMRSIVPFFGRGGDECAA